MPHPLPWYVAGPLIGLIVPALLLIGNLYDPEPRRNHGALRDRETGQRIRVVLGGALERVRQRQPARLVDRAKRRLLNREPIMADVLIAFRKRAR
jgi:hypothetical protein